MASYTTLVHIDEAAASKVASFVAKLDVSGGEAYETELKGYIAKQSTLAFIDKILEKQDLIFALERDNDIEALFQALFSVIYTLNDDTKETATIIRNIVRAVSSNKENKPRVRLNVLAVLFNIIFAGESKSEVLNAILEYSLATQQTSLVAHFSQKADSWIEAWGLTVDASRVLLRNFALVLEKESDKSVAVKALVRYFQTYKNEAGSYPAEVEKLITTAVLSAINSPLDAFGDRIALLESINAQNFSAAVTPLVELLKIVVDGALPEYLAFQTAHKAVFAQYQLDAEALERSVKLLTLSSLAAQASDKQLTFGAIQAALQIDETEVELWVIEAIAEKLLEASIDQLSATVTINRYAHRSFGPAHWRLVQQKLRVLRKQVATAVETLKASKSTAVATN